MLPIVDLADPSAPKKVTDSLLEYGFAVVSNHDIANQELNAFYNAWDSFFTSGAAPQYATDAVSQAGYFSPEQSETAKDSKAQDIKEYFQYWPGGRLPVGLEDITQRYFDAMFDLATRILAWIEENTPPDLWREIDKPLKAWASRQQTLLRVLRYPPLVDFDPGTRIRAGAHEDINFITLLPAANKPGLEIKTGDGWMPVEVPAGSMIINIGDMLQELTRGVLPSTTHQVVNPEGEDASAARLTAPLFCAPYPELVLSERYTAGEYLRERLVQINPETLRPK